VSSDRHPLDAHFRSAVASLERAPAQSSDRPVRIGTSLTITQAGNLFVAQCESRQADLAAKRMQTLGRGYYTIGSSGHEANAGVAAALRPTDPALLHYRSGGFYCARAQQRPDRGIDPLRDILLGVAAATAEPIAGGRHKVFGNAELSIIPQTSTIASHLPRAVGLAFSLDRAHRIGIPTPWPEDAIVVTSFGDASVNHSTLVGAVNSAANTVFQGIGVPLLMVCEDNGYGISTRTPAGWIAQRFVAGTGIRYLAVDGTDVADVYDAALQAAESIRTTRKPTFLHITTVRFLGHAGSDAEVGYRRQSEIEADYARDPLLATARMLAASGAASGEDLLDIYDRIGERAERAITEIQALPQLVTAADVIAPLAPRRPDRVREAASSVSLVAREEVFGGRLPEEEGPLTLAQAINRALHDELARRPEAVVFGEDVAIKGGVYGLTRGLRRTFGSARVFDSVLDEQAILGVALGAGLAGLLPIPEIQYLAYLHNAIDQIRGEAASLQFFSQGQFRNPLIVRIAGLGYQKGFGGHFHNDNALAALRDIPGLVIAVPSHPSDAPAMLRTLTAAARVDGTVGIFLEPIALYHQRDLHAAGDDGWLGEYVGPERWAERHIDIGRASRWTVDDRDGADLTIATFGNGVPMSLRVARDLASRHGVSIRVIDLRWISPLPIDDLITEATATGRVLVVDETRRSGGVSEGVVTALVDAGFAGQIRRVTSEDSFIPLGDAARTVLLSQETVSAAAKQMLGLWH
jgi:2-oxoisovalerate dehydrogenase E1 component